MVLQASDELRHEWDDDPVWRESWYFNFSDPTNRMGGWIYFWVTPNQPSKTGMLVSFYHGVPVDEDSTGRAFASPGHVLRGADGSWVYCFQHDSEELIDADVDDVTFAGLTMQRIEPLERYRLHFDDRIGSSFELDCRFMTEPWDFADNLHETPPWLAKNRYHRAWRASGYVEIAGTRYDVDTTGDSDHSWGTRDSSVFKQNNLKTYALQSSHAGLSVKAQLLGSPGRELPRGYIALGREMFAVRSIRERSSYHPTGEMYDIHLRVEDVAGHVLEAHMDALYAAVAGAAPTVGFEGAGVWNVESWGPCPGIASCWWAVGVTREDLNRGHAGVTFDRS